MTLCRGSLTNGGGVKNVDTSCGGGYGDNVGPVRNQLIYEEPFVLFVCLLLLGTDFKTKTIDSTTTECRCRAMKLPGASQSCTVETP